MSIFDYFICHSIPVLFLTILFVILTIAMPIAIHIVNDFYNPFQLTSKKECTGLNIHMYNYCSAVLQLLKIQTIHNLVTKVKKKKKKKKKGCFID